MYICICHGVTDTAIRRSVEAGCCSSMRDLRDTLGVATQCGRCALHARAVLNESLAELPKLLLAAEAA